MQVLDAQGFRMKNHNDAMRATGVQPTLNVPYSRSTNASFTFTYSLGVEGCIESSIRREQPPTSLNKHNSLNAFSIDAHISYPTTHIPICLRIIHAKPDAYLCVIDYDCNGGARFLAAITSYVDHHSNAIWEHILMIYNENILLGISVKDEEDDE